MSPFNYRRLSYLDFVMFLCLHSSMVSGACINSRVQLSTLSSFFSCKIKSPSPWPCRVVFPERCAQKNSYTESSSSRCQQQRIMMKASSLLLFPLGTHAKPTDNSFLFLVIENKTKQKVRTSTFERYTSFLSRFHENAISCCASVLVKVMYFLTECSIVPVVLYMPSLLPSFFNLTTLQGYL